MKKAYSKVIASISLLLCFSLIFNITAFAGVANSDSFDKTINPIFFYLNTGLKDNSEDSNEEYWYNEEK